MGLAGRKQKQRIPADPRNLSWADDASRFGHAYLSKFGWDASQGLGSSGDGIKTHIKAQQKLDMMGIGAQHQRDPNGIAWKQNKEFEALLKRLNESAEQGKATDDEVVDGKGDGGDEEAVMGNAFVRAREEAEGNPEHEHESSTTSEKQKRKHKGDPHTSEHTGTKQKKAKRQKCNSDDTTAPTPDRTLDTVPKPRPMAHRARIRAATRIAGKSASAIAEILGIAPSSTSTSTPSPAPKPSPDADPAPQASHSLDNLTASTKSIADYFSEKLLARASESSVSASPSSSALSGSATPGLGATGPRAGLSNIPSPDDDSELPRRGIGSQVPAVEPSGKDDLTEKQRRKAERKAEKGRRREAKVGRAVSADANERIQADKVESAEQTFKEQKKQKKRREREQQATADQPRDTDGDIRERRAHDTLCGSVPEPSKKSKKEHKKKRS